MYDTVGFTPGLKGSKEKMMGKEQAMEKEEEEEEEEEERKADKGEEEKTFKDYSDFCYNIITH